MRRPHDHLAKVFFSDGMWQHIIWLGLYIAGISLAAIAWAMNREPGARLATDPGGSGLTVKQRVDDLDLAY